MKDRNLVLLTIVTFIVYIIGLLSAWSKPCAGYESSIYEATPFLFWIGLFCAYFLGSYLILMSIYAPSRYQKWRLLGFLLLILAMISFASLNIIRGYFIYNISGDTGSHIGVMNSIIAGTGTFSSSYPFVHIEPSIIILVSGLQTIDVLSLLPMLMTCITTLGICLIARKLFPSSGEKDITYIIALLLPMGSAAIVGLSYIYYSSGNIAYALIPLFIYCLIKLRSVTVSMTVVTFLFAVVLSFYHPIVGIIGIIAAISVISVVVMNYFIKKEINQKYLSTLVILSTISIVIFLLWQLKNFGSTIVSGLLSLLRTTEGDEMRSIEKTTDIISSAFNYGYSFDTLLQIAAINIVLYILLFIAAILFFKYHRKEKPYSLFWFMAAFGIFIGGITVIAAAGVFNFGYARFMRPIYILLILGAGFTIYRVLTNRHGNNNKISSQRVLLTIFLIFGICILSVFSYYPSPYTLNSGDQTTITEYTGAETLLPHIDYDKKTAGITFTGLQRYVSAIYGSAYTVGSFAYGDYYIISASRGGTEYSKEVPYHFGYDSSLSLSDSYEEGDYIFIIEKDKEFYPAYFPKLTQYRWTPEDFDHLKMDHGLSYVYDNGGLGMYVTR